MIDDSFDDVLEDMYPELGEEEMAELQENVDEGFTREKHAFDGSKEMYAVPIESEDQQDKHVRISW